MSYIEHLTASLDPRNAQLGKPPVKVTAKIGSPPPGSVPAPQPHIESPPYDAAMDPAWKGVLDPSDHELRNLLNGMSPEDRQVLLVRIGRAVPPAAVAPAGAVGAAPAPSPGL